jgi:hypothetical protein
MEFVALSGLVALGVAVSQLASATPKKPKNAEGFHSLGLGILPQNEPPSGPAIPVPSEYYTVGIQQYLSADEKNMVNDMNSRISKSGSPEAIQSMNARIQTILQRGAERASKVKGPAPLRSASNTSIAGAELDMMYTPQGGRAYPSEPNPGPSYGTPLQYGTSMPPMRGVGLPGQGLGQGPLGQGPLPEPIEASVAQVAFASSGVEASSAWVKGSAQHRIVSNLSGQEIESSDFKHNNMQPFFGGRVKQNMTASVNTSKLDMFTGSGSTDIQKQEISPMFNTAIPFGQPFGNEPNADFIRSRIVEPGRRNNEKPF